MSATGPKAKSTAKALRPTRTAMSMKATLSTTKAGQRNHALCQRARRNRYLGKRCAAKSNPGPAGRRRRDPGTADRPGFRDGTTRSVWRMIATREPVFRPSQRTHRYPPGARRSQTTGFARPPRVQRRDAGQVFPGELCFDRAGMQRDTYRLFMGPGQFNCRSMDDLIDRGLGRPIADPAAHPIVANRPDPRGQYSKNRTPLSRQQPMPPGLEPTPDQRRSERTDPSLPLPKQREWSFRARCQKSPARRKRQGQIERAR